MDITLKSPVPGRYMVYLEDVYVGNVRRNYEATTKTGRWIGVTYVQTQVYGVNAATRQACVDKICSHHTPQL